MREVMQHLQTLATTLLAENAGAEFRDGLKGSELADAAAYQLFMRSAVELATEIKSELQKRYDFIRFSLIPEIMDEDGLESARVEGVGRVSLQSDINASVKADHKIEAQDWLIENGYGDVIQETVNSSTLKALLKKRIKEGLDIPADLFNVSPFTRAQITK